MSFSQRAVRPGRPISGSTSRMPPTITAVAMGRPTIGISAARSLPARFAAAPIQRVVTRRSSPATSIATPPSAIRKIGTTISGGAAMSIPASRVMARRISFFAPNEHPTEEPGDLRQPEPGARLRHPLRRPRVHLPVPEDRAARLRHHSQSSTCPTRLCVELKSLEALPLVLPDEGGASTRRSPTASSTTWWPR